MAGYETSANTLVYAINLLACYPKIQQALQADLDKILGDVTLTPGLLKQTSHGFLMDTWVPP